MIPAGILPLQGLPPPAAHEPASMTIIPRAIAPRDPCRKGRWDEEKRRRAMFLMDHGVSTRNVARALEIGRGRLRGEWTQWKSGVYLEEEKWRREEAEIVKRAIIEVIQANCAVTIKGIQAALETRGVVKDAGAVQQLMKELKFTKKRLRRVPLQRNSARRLLYRQEYCRMISQLPMENLVFMDETSISQQTALSFGWARKGQNPFIHVPADQKQCLSLVAAISVRGFQATRIVKGPVTNRHICDFLQHNLDHMQPWEVLVLDNARVHHAASVKEKMLQLNMSVRYLPAYTPQLNPIENVFAEVKAQFIRRRTKGHLTLKQLEQILHDSIRNLKSKSFQPHFLHYSQWVEKGIAGDMFI